MRQNPIDDRLLRSYLLGELPEPEADRLEERLLADDELFDLLEALEAELLAACSRGELAPAERERVLRRLASSPQGRERLALAGSLNTLADGLPRQAAVVPFPNRAATPKAVFQWAAMAAGLLLVASLSWFSLQTPREGNSPPLIPQDGKTSENRIVPPPPPPVASTPTPRQPERAPEQIAEKGHAATKRPELVKAVFVLSLTTLRGGEEETQELDLKPGADIAEIQLNDLAGVEEFESFHVAIRNEEKGTIWEKDGLTSRQQDGAPALVLDVPAEKLAGGLYEVRVQGIPAEGEPEDLAIQEFRVVRAGRM